jgi:hypothetical protein
MKADKQNAGSTAWIQLSGKIRDADQSREKENNDLHNQILSILGKKRMRVTIPKNSKAISKLIQQGDKS